MILVLKLLVLAPTLCAARTGLLHPQESESREIKSLDGLWRFKADASGVGMRDNWELGPLPSPTMLMPVPASYNDLTQDASLREHVGLVWYECTAFVPLHWMTRRVVLFVGSAGTGKTYLWDAMTCGWASLSTKPRSSAASQDL